MNLKHSATAGTMESSDAMVTIDPVEKGLDIEITSPVLNQYGNQINKIVRDSLANLEIYNARVTVNDMGALDCTLKARVECAIYRACDESKENLPWGGSIK